MTFSMAVAKSGRPETCTLYCLTPSFGVHESNTRSGPASVLSPTGSPIERVKGGDTEHGPGVLVPGPCLGNSARTREWESAVPVGSQNVVPFEVPRSDGGAGCFWKVSYLEWATSIGLGFDPLRLGEGRTIQ